MAVRYKDVFAMQDTGTCVQKLALKHQRSANLYYWLAPPPSKFAFRCKRQWHTNISTAMAPDDDKEGGAGGSKTKVNMQTVGF